MNQLLNNHLCHRLVQLYFKFNIDRFIYYVYIKNYINKFGLFNDFLYEFEDNWVLRPNATINIVIEEQNNTKTSKY